MAFSWERRTEKMQIDGHTVSETVSEYTVQCQPQLVILGSYECRKGIMLNVASRMERCGVNQLSRKPQQITTSGRPLHFIYHQCRSNRRNRTADVGSEVSPNRCQHHRRLSLRLMVSKR